MIRVLLLVLMLAGCSTSSGGGAAGCHGARRPANPHGSVLAPDTPPPSAQPTPAAGGCGAAR